MSNSVGTGWVTSKEILEKTGISRATLNNYIKMGILPRPIVRRDESAKGGSKQVGYFPRDVLGRIGTVKLLKGEGDSMKDIAKKIQGLSTAGEIHLHNQRPRRASPPGDDLYQRIAKGGLTLTINDISSPAFLVNRNFEIEWINKEAEDTVFNQNVRSISDLESRNIFRLFFNREFQNKFQNWEELIAFHMRFLKSFFPKSHLSNLYNGISEREVALLERLYDETAASHTQSVQHDTVDFVMQDGTVKSHQIYRVIFREGIFFVCVSTDNAAEDVTKLFAHRERIINELLKQRLPSLVSLCVLVADVQDSVKISAELLPEEYFDLINQIRRSLDECVDRYEGIYGKHAGDGMLYYFIKKPGYNHILNGISCALELKDAMKKISAEWKIRKGWINEMFLNIGINEGQEYFGAVRSSSIIEFTALGDSVNYAARLSDFARHGSIWTTKNVINKLSKEDREKVKFGVYRKQHDREIFIPNSFSRIVDLWDKDHANYGKFMDIIAAPITEII